MKKQRAKKHEMIIVGRPNSVKVVNGDINSALKLWKRELKESGKLELLKEKKEYVKPSVLKRKKRTDAEYSQYLETKRNIENNG
jgi:ribosomal protein S21